MYDVDAAKINKNSTSSSIFNIPSRLPPLCLPSSPGVFAVPGLQRACRPSSDPSAKRPDRRSSPKARGPRWSWRPLAAAPASSATLPWRATTGARTSFHSLLRNFDGAFLSYVISYTLLFQCCSLQLVLLLLTDWQQTQDIVAQRMQTKDDGKEHLSTTQPLQYKKGLLKFVDVASLPCLFAKLLNYYTLRAQASEVNVLGLI